MYRRFRTLLAAATVLAFVLAGCRPIQDTGAAAGAKEITLYVGPELVDCVSVAPQKCMLVKENLEDEYQYFYSTIEGFAYEPGYNYTLRVRVAPVANAPADASSLQYTLVEIINKEPTMTNSTESVTLEGPTWQLSSVADANGEITAVPEGVEATAMFADGAVSGSAGCNNFRAGYTVDGENLTILPGPMTMMACPEPQMTVEQQFVAALSATASYAIVDGQLELSDANRQVLATLVVQEPASLTGGTWVATRYNNGRGAAVSILADTQITALFGDDGSLTGSAGCNNYMTDYTIDGATISIQPAASTRKACPGPIMQQENEYLSALPTAAMFSIRGDKLELRTADGALVASYRVGQ